MKSAGQCETAVTAVEYAPAPPASRPADAKAALGPSLCQALHANARKCRDSTAYRAKVRGLWKSWSWGEVESEVVRIHATLVRVGLRSGEIVAIGGEANPRLYWYFLAVQRAGAVPLLLNSRIFAPEFVSAHAKAQFAVFVAGSETQVDVAVIARPLCPRLRLVLALDRGLDVDTHGGFVATESELQGPDWAYVSGEPPAALQADRSVVISTYDEAGDNILVVCSHASVAKAAKEFATLGGMKANDELVSFLPISWFGEFLQFSAALFKGALLSSVENSATVFQDLRVLAPDIMLAPISFYRRILARIEADICHSPRIFRCMYDWSNSMAARKAERGRVSSFRAAAAQFLEIAFRAPLRNVLGLSNVRSAFCAEGVLPPDLASRFENLGVEIRPIDLDPRYGGVLASVASRPAETGSTIVAVEGIELTRSCSGATLCRSDFPAMGVLQDGAMIAPPNTDADGRGRACVSGKIDETGALTSLEEIDLDELDDRVAISLRAHVTRLNSKLAIRHSIVRPDGKGAWVAVINPDLDFLRAMSPDAGSRYHELIEQREVVSALAGIIEDSNVAAKSDGAGAVTQLSSFAWFAKPLSADERTLTRNGGLRRRQVQSLLPASVLDPASPHVRVAHLSKASAV